MLASGCQGAGCARGWQASWPLLMSSKKAAEFVWGTAAAADIRRRAGRDWVSETASKAGTIDACARIREFSDKSGACACACARACVTWTLDFLPLDHSYHHKMTSCLSRNLKLREEGRAPISRPSCANCKASQSAMMLVSKCRRP